MFGALAIYYLIGVTLGIHYAMREEQKTDYRVAYILIVIVLCAAWIWLPLVILIGLVKILERFYD